MRPGCLTGPSASCTSWWSSSRPGSPRQGEVPRGRRGRCSGGGGGGSCQEAAHRARAATAAGRAPERAGAAGRGAAGRRAAGRGAAEGREAEGGAVRQHGAGKARFDESRIAAGLPCGTEEFLLIFARWKKLERDIYNPRKDRFNISKIPDVYDSAKYDLVHNRHLHLKGLHELFLLAKEMANGVIPNEYGITPYSKLNIGAKVARRLLGKLLIDLHNTRDEAVAVGQAMQQHRQCLKEQRAAAVAAAVFNQEQARQHRRSSGEAKRRSDGQPEGDNDDSNAAV
ncbi:hypothetical protein CLOM_g9869 [Closterium sp. NIES-68]|nr:hypothetical protein CLOM_g9869 [Closterium sp. NIES-68]